MRASLALHPGGKVLVAVGASGAVNVIDLESWEVMEVLKQHLPKPSLAAKALAAKGNRAEGFPRGEGRRRREDRGRRLVGGGPSDAPVSSRAVSTSDVGCPAVSHACASADGQWLALVTTADRAFGGAPRRACTYITWTPSSSRRHRRRGEGRGAVRVAAIALSQGGVLAIAGPG